jgi:hypothetical protein
LKECLDPLPHHLSSLFTNPCDEPTNSSHYATITKQSSVQLTFKALVKFSTAFGLVLRNKPTIMDKQREKDKERKDEMRYFTWKIKINVGVNGEKEIPIISLGRRGGGGLPFTKYDRTNVPAYDNPRPPPYEIH